MLTTNNKPEPTNSQKAKEQSDKDTPETKKGNAIFIAGGAVIVAALMQFLGC